KHPLTHTLFPYTTLFRSHIGSHICFARPRSKLSVEPLRPQKSVKIPSVETRLVLRSPKCGLWAADKGWSVFRGKRDLADRTLVRSEEHTSELQSRFDLVC